MSKSNIIERLRTGAGLTQVALAERIGGKWNQGRISSLESERNGPPNYQTVSLVAKACGKTATFCTADGWTIDP